MRAFFVHGNMHENAAWLLTILRYLLLFFMSAPA